jgi:site-specific DNA recombinase
MEKKCMKCGYDSEENKTKFGLFLCNICHTFSPNSPEKLDEYTDEKVDESFIKSFRKFAKLKGENQKQGMVDKASKGVIMSRAPFGYKIENKQLIPAQNAREIEEIFEEFLNKTNNLTQLSKKHNLSVNGLKKILTNFTYIGKIKFNNQIHDGKHQPIISSTLFNHVQNKLDKLKIKKP